jgi:hypothetical protein
MFLSKAEVSPLSGTCQERAFTKDSAGQFLNCIRRISRTVVYGAANKWSSDKLAGIHQGKNGASAPFDVLDGRGASEGSRP